MFVVRKRCQDGQGFAYFSIRACFHSSHVVQSLTALTNTEFVFSKPDAPLRTAQWDRARLAQFCSCPLPQASKNAKSIRIYQKILQFNLAHLIEIIFLQIFPQSISLIWSFEAPLIFICVERLEETPNIPKPYTVLKQKQHSSPISKRIENLNCGSKRRN